jgi:hypothetical protein
MKLPEEERHLCLLIVDEAKHVFNNQTERILTECRKANVGYLAATQLLSQIPDDVRSAIYGATAIKIAGAVQSSDANQLSREMYCSPDFIRSMEPVRGSHADWAFYVQEVTRGHAVKVRLPYGVLEAMPKLNKFPSQPEASHLPADSLVTVEHSVPYTPTLEGPTKPEPLLDDANGRIDKALRLLTPHLQTVIEKELRRVHSDNWQQNRSIAQGSDPNQPLDAYAAFKTMLDNWQSCFKDIFKIKTRTDISKALEARNAISHATHEIPAADAISYLTAIRGVALAISASAVADSLKVLIDAQIKSAATAMNLTTQTLAESPEQKLEEPLLKPTNRW